MRQTRRLTAAGLLLMAVAVAGSCGLQSAASVASSLGEVLHGDHGLSAADGVLPDNATVFDDRDPGVVNLDPALLDALRAATADAARDGITIYVNSGWRSPSYQDELLREAIAQYGSADEAARWVATADTSPHVAGDAVDIGHTTADAWLSRHGAAYGLCQIYRNEPWHYELRPAAINGKCPRMYADPTHDPRMQP
jgi:D-alanyl-D-alanine carboxypeptidase